MVFDFKFLVFVSLLEVFFMFLGVWVSFCVGSGVVIERGVMFICFEVSFCREDFFLFRFILGKN